MPQLPECPNRKIVSVISVPVVSVPVDVCQMSVTRLTWNQYIFNFPSLKKRKILPWNLIIEYKGLITKYIGKLHT